MGGIAICFAISSLLPSCSKFEEREFAIDKPQSLIDQEARDANYKELKTYVNYSNQPNFKLGVELDLATVADSTSVLYRLMRKHFDEINFTRLNHMDFVDASGSIDMTNLTKALETTKSQNVPGYAGHLVQHNNQRSAYLNTLIPDLIIPGASGTYVVENFESRAVGSSFPVYYSTTTTTGTATISTDPVAGATNSGKTLKVVGNRAFPQYQVTLPAGVTLGDCKKLVFDTYVITGGHQGAGISIGVSTALGPVPSGRFLKPGKSFQDLGVTALNTWNRNLQLDLSLVTFTPEEKQLNTFVLTFMNETGSADLHLDNLRLDWTKTGQVIPKTAAEKKTIYTAELDKWIKAIGTAGKGKITSWSVVYQPIDENDPTKLRTGVGAGTLPANTFYWQDYLGRDYAATAIKMLKQYANTTDKMYITETGLVGNPAKVQGLRDFISYTESQGANVDGIATELALNVDADKAKVEAMLQALAASGKLIKISALDIGTGTTTAQATPALYQQQSDMYKWFVKAYNSLIPAAQRAGITFRSPHDRVSGDSWRSNEPVGLWTRFNTGSTVLAGYQRKPAYVGVVEAFQGK